MNEPSVLLVEDTSTDVLLTRRALKKSQISAELLVATDGLEAWQLLKGRIGVSLILLDLHLPKLDGLHFLEQLRNEETTRSLPVVVVTSSELTSDRSIAMSLGANAYLSKPIDPTKLKNVIETLDIDELKPSTGRQGE